MKLTDAVVAVLEERGWPHETDDGLVRTVVRTDDLAFPMAVVPVEDAGQVVVYSVLPDLVEADQRAAVAELATLANAALTVGNLEIELDAGQVRFRTSLGLGDVEPIPALIDRVIVDNAASAVACFPLVTRVVGGELTPDEAVAVLRR
jgi:hypothetical protein